MMSARDTT